MKKSIVILAVSLISMIVNASEDTNLIKKLAEAKLSLKDAITLAEKTSGPATSAKFEMDGEQLVFSVYTAPQGPETSAEETELTEFSGNATVLPIVSKTEIFTDKEHISRASAHLTLKQLSRFSLSEIIDLALVAQNGIAYSIKNPIVKNHRAVADILILTKKGNIETVSVDMITGKIIH